MKLKVKDVALEPLKVGNRIEFKFNAPENLDYVTLKKGDFLGDLKLEEIQLEQSTLSTSFVEPMESETVESGLFKSVKGISYEITNPNSDTWLEIKRTSEASISTYHNGTLKSTIAQTIENIMLGIGDIAGGDEASFDLRLDGITQSVKDNIFSSVQTQLSDFVGLEIKDLEGNYNRIANTVHAHTQTIGSDGGNLAQKVMTDSLFQIRITDRITSAQSSITQLSNQIGLRVNGSQITIGGDNIIIDSKSIYLNSSTQIKDGIITNRLLAENISADKISAGTLNANNIRVINLDAGNISTGTLQGIRINAQTGNMGDWELGWGVLHSPLLSGGYTTLKATGNVAFATSSDSPYSTTGAGLQIWHNGQLRWNYGEGLIWPGRTSGLVIESNSYIHLRPSASVEVDGRVIPRYNGQGTLGADNLRWYRSYVTVAESVSSDARLKNDVKDVPEELISKLSELRPKLYKIGGKRHFGYIAQDVERVLYKYALDKVGRENAQEYVKQFDVLDRTESYMSLVYTELAALKSEEMQRKISGLENELEKLKNKMEELVNEQKK